MFGLFDHLAQRPVAPEERMPGQYVKRHYDAAIGGTLDTIRTNSLRFFASGFGKGVLAVATVAIAALAISSGIAAASGALPVMGSFGLVTNATFAQGIMIGIGKAAAFLMSGPGLLTMAGAGLVGASVEGRRHPERMSVEEARALSAHYAENRQQATLLQMQKAPMPEAEPQSRQENEPADKTPAFAAKELQRRASQENALMEQTR